MTQRKNKKPRNSVNDIWDYIIIGAGITGLYAAYRLRQNADPSARILILEAGCRIGGRMAMVDFHGVKVEPGAGIGRLEKDLELRRLLEELGIKWQEFPVSHNYSLAAYDSTLSNPAPKNIKIGRIGKLTQYTELPEATEKLTTPDWIKKQVKKLQLAYKKNPVATTFHAFAQKILGKLVYRQLVMALGYTDYEKEDVAETLFNYGLDDLYSPWTGMGINWQELMDSLVEHSFADIRLNTPATKISLHHSSDGTPDTFFKIHTTYYPPHTATTTLKKNTKSRHTTKTLKTKINRPNIPNIYTTNSIGCHTTHSNHLKHRKLLTHEFRARKVLIATTITPAMELVSGFIKDAGLRRPIQMSGVQSQSFLRIYGYFTGENQQIMNKYIKHTQVVPGGYHRVIPMGTNDNGKSGVYMIVYTDNKSADNLEHLCTNTSENRRQLAEGLKIALGIPIGTYLEIDDILGYYWREGTHYYTPLNYAKFGSRNEFLYAIQRPIGENGGLFLAGEAFSRQQGWTEGTIQSVNAVLGDLL